jgi:hypothetical protein
MSSSLPSARLEGRRSKPHHDVPNVFTGPSERKTHENGEESTHLPPQMSAYPLAPEFNPNSARWVNAVRQAMCRAR